MKFKIVVPTYNAEKWIIRCISSIITQTHKDFECIIIDDCSTDNTPNILEQIKPQLDERFTVIKSEKNAGPLASHVLGWDTIGVNDNDVLVTVDGDDWLFSEYSLAICNQYYEAKNPLMTYGNHIHYPTGDRSNVRELPKGVFENNGFRDHPFVTSHLRTLKGIIWNSIDKNDLRDDDGEYFRAGGDYAYMVMALELASPRIICIPQVLYVYNRQNPLSEEYMFRKENAETVNKVKKRKRYEALKI